MEQNRNETTPDASVPDLSGFDTFAETPEDYGPPDPVFSRSGAPAASAQALTAALGGSAPRALPTASSQMASGMPAGVPHAGSSAVARGSQFSRGAVDTAYYAEKASASRRRKRVLHAVAGVLVAAFAVFAVAAFAYLGNVSSNLNSGIDDDTLEILVDIDAAREPFYMLLMGTDQSLQRDEDGSTGGTYRTDSMILARVDARHKQVTLVSIPRDTDVDLGEYGEHKINAAYAFGGPQLAIEAVSKLSGVGISHFALVDMDGLREAVDALGGIEVDVPVAIDDDMAGGYVPAGVQTLNGEEALIFARSRHNFDDYGDGDSYRAANQRLVITAIARKLLASDPVTLASTVERLSQYVQTDLTVTEIVGLAQALQGLDTSKSLYTAQVPTDSVYTGGAWLEAVRIDEWQEMMNRIYQGLPPYEQGIIDEQTGTIMAASGDGAEERAALSAALECDIYVRNGTPNEGLGIQVAELLEAQGFYVADVGNADSDDYAETLVIYEDVSYGRAAQAVADFLGHGARAMQNDDSYVLHGDLTVVVGTNWR